jgi:FkbM family methyltransferase
MKKQISAARRNVELITKLGRKYRNGTLLDLGANIGEVSLQCSHWFEKTLAVESDPQTATVLRRRLRGYPVQVINYAVAGVNGETRFIKRRDKLSVSNSVSKSADDGPSILTISFESLLQYWKPTVIKMDIEGSEYECLAGVHPGAVTRAIVVEFHYLRTRKTEAEECIRRLLLSGYTTEDSLPQDDNDVGTITFERRT